MKQIFHPYWKWEDYKNGMWKRVSPTKEATLIKKAIIFTGDHILYGKAMRQVIDKWKYSSEHNLSNTSINRKAWIGHAACSLRHKLPEYIVRLAWWQLTEKQRTDADNQALNTIKEWEQKKRLESTLKRGRSGVIQKGFQMKLQMN